MSGHSKADDLLLAADHDGDLGLRSIHTEGLAPAKTAAYAVTPT